MLFLSQKYVPFTNFIYHYLFAIVKYMHFGYFTYLTRFSVKEIYISFIINIYPVFFYQKYTF